MRGMTTRWGVELELAASYRETPERYLAKRNVIENLGTDFSGDGRPRVKPLEVV